LKNPTELPPNELLKMNIIDNKATPIYKIARKYKASK